MHVPRPLIFGAALWTAGTIAFTSIDSTMSSRGPEGPEHLTQQQQDEREHVHHSRVKRSEDDLRNGLDAERHERLVPGEHRMPENPGKAVGSFLVRR